MHKLLHCAVKFENKTEENKTLEMHSLCTISAVYNFFITVSYDRFDTVWLVDWEDEMTTLPSTTSSTMVTTLRVVEDVLELEVETLQR